MKYPIFRSRKHNRANFIVVTALLAWVSTCSIAIGDGGDLQIMSPLPLEMNTSMNRNSNSHFEGLDRNNNYRQIDNGNFRKRTPPKVKADNSEQLVRVLLYLGENSLKVGATQGVALVDGKRMAVGEVTIGINNLTRAHKFTPSAGLITLGGNAYRGHLEAYPINGKLQIINVLSLEDYLRGVVPKELLDNSLEPMKAQAILARTYALSMMAKSDPRSKWDLRSDTGHQVYAGSNAERSISDKAIRETKGQVLSYGGKLCAAILYHSTCGGYTESNEDAYGTPPVPYLRAVSCGLKQFVEPPLATRVPISLPKPTDSSPKKKKNTLGWRADGAKLNEHLDIANRPSTLEERRARYRQERGEMPRQITAVVPKSNFVPTALGLNFSLGCDVENMKDRFRYASGGTDAWCNGSSFARWEACWTPEELGQELGRNLGKSSFPIVDLEVLERTSSGRVKKLSVKFSNGITSTIGGDTIRNSLRYRNANGAWCVLPSTRFEIAELSKKVIRIRGTGWGHGVGMCQWGAKKLASSGYDAAKILDHYYAGTKIISARELGFGSSGR